MTSSNTRADLQGRDEVSKQWEPLGSLSQNPLCLRLYWRKVRTKIKHKLRGGSVKSIKLATKHYKHKVANLAYRTSSEYRESAQTVIVKDGDVVHVSNSTLWFPLAGHYLFPDTPLLGSIDVNKRCQVSADTILFGERPCVVSPLMKLKDSANWVVTAHGSVARSRLPIAWKLWTAPRRQWVR